MLENAETRSLLHSAACRTYTWGVQFVITVMTANDGGCLASHVKEDFVAQTDGNDL